LQLQKLHAQKFESVRPELPIEHAPGTIEAIAIKIITVVAFYRIVWYHAHMQISPSYPVKRILALAAFARSWLASPKPRKTAAGMMSLADISLQTTAETARTLDTQPLLARW
jgi:hypothetical protein